MIDLPPEVVEKLAERFPWIEDITIEAILAALIAHAGSDATHIDLSTWRGVRATEVGGWNDAGDAHVWEERTAEQGFDSIPLFTINGGPSDA